jgi:hypothetical protein
MRFGIRQPGLLARRLLLALEEVKRALQDQTDAVSEATKIASAKQAVPQPVRAEVSLPEGVETRKSAIDALSDRVYQRRTLLVSVLTFIAIVIYAGLVYLQWKEMIGAAGAAQDAVHEARLNRQQSQESLNAAIDQFHLDQRAWVGPTNIVLRQIPVPNPIMAVATITNYGKTPAFKLRARYFLRASDTPIDVRQYAKNPIEQMAVQEQRTTNILFPNAHMDLVPSTGSTDALGNQSVGNGRKLLYFFGWVWYSDVFQMPHETRFCAQWYAQGKGFAPCSEDYDYSD